MCSNLMSGINRLFNKTSAGVLVWILMHFGGMAFTQESRLNFFSLTRTNGLSNNEVTSIIKDHRGYMWIGTINGLNRYNGRDFKIYRSSAQNANALPGNHIVDLKLDQAGELWIAVFAGGVAKYNPLTDNFQSYSLITEWENVSPDEIRGLCVDHNNHIWAFTAGGLFLYDRQHDTFELIPVINEAGSDQKLFATDSLSVLNYDIPAVTADEAGGIWIVYRDLRLSYLDFFSNTSVQFPIIRGVEAADEINTIHSVLYEDGKLYIASQYHGLIVYDTENQVGELLLEGGLLSTATDMIVHDQKLWVSSFNGIVAVDLTTRKYIHYLNRPGDPRALRSAATNTVFIDDFDILWVGVVNAGINYANIHMPFHQLFEDLADPGMLSESKVNTMLHDSKGNLWVGYQSGNIEVLSSKDQERFGVGVRPLRRNAGVGAIFEIFEDSEGDIYMGSWLGGLQKYDKAQNVFRSVERRYQTFIDKFGGVDTRRIVDDRNGHLWLIVHGQGLLMFNKRTGDTRLFRSDPSDGNRLSNAHLFDLCFDEEGQLWITTAWGVNRLSATDTIFTRYFADGLPGSVISSGMPLIFKDSQDRIWLGGNEGLSLYNPFDDAFVNISFADHDLPSLLIKSIQEDAFGNLWIGSSMGIINLNVSYADTYEPLVDDYFIYDVQHGLLSEDYFLQSSSKDPEGRLYFGGESGIDYFRPEDFNREWGSAPIHIEEIRMLNSVVYPGAEGGPKINKHGEVVFSHKENMLGIRYASLNYLDLRRPNYFYRLQPIDEEWIDMGKEHNVIFHNMAPGKYVFQVKYALDPTDESEITSSSFRIKPPFWKTNIFRLLFLFVLLGIFWTIYYVRTANIRKKKFLLERQVRVRTDELNKTNAMKDKLISVISHDLRNPFGNVIGLVDLLNKNYDQFDEAKRKELVRHISYSADQAFTLFDNLLQWTMSQRTQLQLHKKTLNLHEQVERCFELTRSAYLDKEVSFSNRVTSEVDVTADPEVLQIIIRNLITNALKFTLKGGKVLIDAAILAGHMVRIDVSDTGIGIPPEKTASLFSTTGIDNTKGTEGESGSGLGLTLCKEFVEKLGGEIWLSNTSPEGTTFSFSLPAADS